MGNLYGYVRVSTREQNEDRQMIAMNGARVPEKNIYILINSPARISTGLCIKDC